MGFNDLFDSGVHVVNGDFLTLMFRGGMFRGQQSYTDYWFGPELRVFFRIGKDGDIRFSSSRIEKKWGEG